MEAFRVHIKYSKIEYGICKQDPYFQSLKKIQQRSKNTELLRVFCPFLDSITFYPSLVCLWLFSKDLLREQQAL